MHECVVSDRLEISVSYRASLVIVLGDWARESHTCYLDVLSGTRRCRSSPINREAIITLLAKNKVGSSVWCRSSRLLSNHGFCRIVISAKCVISNNFDFVRSFFGQSIDSCCSNVTQSSHIGPASITD